VFNGHPKKSKYTEQHFRLSNDVIGKSQKFIKLKNAEIHNLKNVNASFPIGKVTAVCGVSGSGKTSLIQSTLYPLVADLLEQKLPDEILVPKKASIGPTATLKAMEQIMLVSQSALGRSSRSNIATYLGVMDEMRKLLAATPKASGLKLKAGAFSFNTKGGRCETCCGLGTVVEDLSFLGEMQVICPTCSGKRFDDTVLSVEYNKKNLIQMLEMTVEQARSHFFDRPKVVKVLDMVVQMGLGYVTLGQKTSSFSGGEAQRLKLLSLMINASRSKPSILLLDEPTTGLSDRDVMNLIGQLEKLKELGHTVIVVEHHLGLIKSADWVVEIGPEASENGGELVFEGQPRDLMKIKKSLTAPYLN
jgi:excinuclease ABC subunit A